MWTCKHAAGYIYKRKHLTLSWTFIRKMEKSNPKKPFSSSTLSHDFFLNRRILSDLAACGLFLSRICCALCSGYVLLYIFFQTSTAFGTLIVNKCQTLCVTIIV